MKGSAFYGKSNQSPLSKDLVGKQGNLPEHLKAEIEAAPGKMDDAPGKMYDSPTKMKSPAKLAGNFITYPDGTREQVSKKAASDHKKQLDAAYDSVTEIGRQADLNPGTTGDLGMDPTAFEESAEGMAIKAERDQAILDMGELTTTGKESLDALRKEMSAEDRKLYGSPGHEKYQAKYKDRATAWNTAQQEVIDEKDSGVAQNQKDLNEASYQAYLANQAK